MDNRLNLLELNDSDEENKVNAYNIPDASMRSVTQTQSQPVYSNESLAFCSQKSLVRGFRDFNLKSKSQVGKREIRDA